MDGGADVVYGQRRRRDGETAFKRATASLFYRLIASLSEVKIPRDTGDFRLINRKVLAVFLGMPEQHRFIPGMMSRIGGRHGARPPAGKPTPRGGRCPRWGGTASPAFRSGPASWPPSSAVLSPAPPAW